MFLVVCGVDAIGHPGMKAGHALTWAQGWLDRSVGWLV
jgi:hypothetical protein